MCAGADSAGSYPQPAVGAARRGQDVDSWAKAANRKEPPWTPSPLTSPGAASARLPSCFTKPLHDLGLGVYLAHSQASALLPKDYQLSEDIEPLADLDNRTPLQLLTEAEELTRPLALDQPEPAHGSQLVLDLCDLIREARRNGY